MIPILAIIVSLIPGPGPIKDTVDRIEVNNYSQDGHELTFTQLIFWERVNGTWMVQDWRMLDQSGMYPRKNPRTGPYSILWNDKNQMRQILSPQMIETWTTYDPELLDREKFPQDLRRKLSPSRLLKHNKREIR